MVLLLGRRQTLYAVVPLCRVLCFDERSPALSCAHAFICSRCPAVQGIGHTKSCLTDILLSLEALTPQSCQIVGGLPEPICSGEQPSALAALVSVCFSGVKLGLGVICRVAEAIWHHIMGCDHTDPELQPDCRVPKQIC